MLTEYEVHRQLIEETSENVSVPGYYEEDLPVRGLQHCYIVGNFPNTCEFQFIIDVQPSTHLAPKVEPMLVFGLKM